MYFVTVEVLPLCRNHSSSALLLSSFLDVVAGLAESGIFFRHICTNDYTGIGTKLCQHLRMTPIGPHVDHGNIHHEKFLTFLSNLLEMTPVLMNQYRETLRLYKASPCR
jgi:hypothetical protein